MKKSWRSLLLGMGVLFTTCFYVGEAVADPDAVKIQWQGIPSNYNATINPVFVYKRVKNPVTTDTVGCSYTGKKNNGLEGAVSPNASSQCYVWRQVGYLRDNAGWIDSNLSHNNNFVFIDPPGTKDAYGAHVAYKLAQAEIDPTTGILKKWVGLQAFTVNQITPCTGGNCTVGIFSDVSPNVYNYWTAQLAQGGGAFSIPFDYSKHLPEFYISPKAQKDISVTIWNSSAADSWLLNIIHDTLSDKNIQLSANKFTNAQVPIAVTSGHERIKWEDMPTKTVMASLVWYGFMNELSYTNGAPNNGPTFQYNIFPSETTYCMGSNVGNNPNQDGQPSLMPITSAFPDLIYYCPAQTNYNLQTKVFCPDSNGCASPAPLDSSGLGNLFVFYSKGVPYVSWENNAQKYKQFNTLVNGTVNFNISVTGDFPVIPLNINNLQAGVNEVGVSPSMYSGLSSTDAFLKVKFLQGPIVHTSNPTASDLSIDSDNNLTGSFYATAIPAYDLKNDISAQAYNYGSVSATDSCAQNAPPPCNPGWQAGSQNIDVSYSSADGKVSIGPTELAPAFKYGMFFMLSSSGKPFQDLYGGTYNAPWNPIIETCGTNLLPAVGATLTRSNFCAIGSNSSPIMFNNTNPYSIDNFRVSKVDVTLGQQPTVTFTLPQLQPADVYASKYALTTDDFTFTYLIDAGSTQSLGSPIKCDDGVCSVPLDLSSYSPGSHELTLYGAIKNASKTSTWLNPADTTISSLAFPFTIPTPALTAITVQPVTLLSPTDIQVSWTGGAPDPAGSGLSNTVKITAICNDSGCPPGVGSATNPLTATGAVSPHTMTGLAPGHTYVIKVTSTGTGYTGVKTPTTDATVNPSPVTPSYKLNPLAFLPAPSFTGSGDTGNNLVTIDWRSNNSGDVYYTINGANTYLNPTSPGVTVNVNYKFVLCSGSVSDYSDCDAAKIGDAQTFTYADTANFNFSKLTAGATYTVCASIYGSAEGVAPSVVAPATVTNQLSTETACKSFEAQRYVFTATSINFQPVQQNPTGKQSRVLVSWDKLHFKTNDSQYGGDISYKVTCTQGNQDCVVLAGDQLTPGAGAGGGAGNTLTTKDTEVTLVVSPGGSRYNLQVEGIAPAWMGNVTSPTGTTDVAYYQLASNTISGITATMGATTTDALVSWPPVVASPATLPDGAAVQYTVSTTPSTGVSSTVNPCSAAPCTATLSGLTPDTSYTIQVNANLSVNSQTLSASGSGAKPYAPEPFTLTPLVVGALQRDFPSTGNIATVAWTGGDLSPTDDSVDVTVQAVACLTKDYTAGSKTCSQTNPPSDSLDTTNQTPSSAKSLTVDGLEPGADYTLILTATPKTSVHGQTVAPVTTTTDFTAMAYSLSGPPTIDTSKVKQTSNELTVSWADLNITNNVNSTVDDDVTFTLSCTTPNGAACNIGYPDSTATDATISAFTAGKYTLTVTANAASSKSWMQVAPTTDSQTVNYYQFSQAPVISSVTAKTNAQQPTVTWSAAQLSPDQPDMSSNMTYTVSAVNTTDSSQILSKSGLLPTITSYTFNDTDQTTLSLGATYDITVTAKAQVQGASLNTASKSSSYAATQYVLAPPTLSADDVTTTTSTLTVKNWQSSAVTPKPKAGQGPTTYTVSVCKSGEQVPSCTWSKSDISDIATGVTFPTGTQDALTPGTTYSVYVTQNVTVLGQQLSSTSTPAVSAQMKGYTLNPVSFGANAVQQDLTNDSVTVTWSPAVIINKDTSKPSQQYKPTYEYGTCAASSVSDSCVTQWIPTGSKGEDTDVVIGSVTPGAAPQKLWVRAVPPTGISLEPISASVQYAIYQFSQAPVVQPTIKVGTTDATVIWANAAIAPDAALSYKAVACLDPDYPNNAPLCSVDNQIIGQVSGNSASFAGLLENQAYTVWVTANTTVNGGLSESSKPQSFRTSSGFKILSIPTPSKANTTLELTYAHAGRQLLVEIPAATFSTTPDSVSYKLKFSSILGDFAIPLCTLNGTSGYCDLTYPVSPGEEYHISVTVIAEKDGVEKSLTSGQGKIAIGNHPR